MIDHGDTWAANVPIASISIGARKRSLSMAKVTELADSIAQVGLLSPILVACPNYLVEETDDFRLVAGLHRLEAHRQLGLAEIPATIICVELDALDAELAEIDENLIRNDLTALERAEHLAARKAIYEQRHPEAKQGGDRRSESAVSNGQYVRSFAADAAAKTGVNERTVRRDVQIASSIPEPIRDAIRDTPVADNQQELLRLAKLDADEQAAVAEKLASGEAKKVAQAARAVRRAEAVTTGQALPDATDAYRLITAACGDPETLAAIGEATVDLIITDPPYGEQYIDCYEALSDLAGRALKPGGSLLAMAGQSYLPKLMFRMGNPALDLRYQWTLAYLTPGGQSAQLWERRVNTFWKPVLWYVKGTYEGDWIGDVTRSDTNSNDKEHHDWGQSVSGMRDLMERFAEPGMTVLDPFCGGGTTGLIALQMGCRFIGVDTDPDAIAQTKARLTSLDNGTRGEDGLA